MRDGHGLVHRFRVPAGRSSQNGGARVSGPGLAADTPVSRNNVSRTIAGRTAPMLGFVAAILFAIAFIINAANVSISNAIFTPTSLMLLGLACLALHLSGVGTSWKYRR
jgi:hypothetical protein